MTYTAQGTFLTEGNYAKQSGYPYISNLAKGYIAAMKPSFTYHHVKVIRNTYGV